MLRIGDHGRERPAVLGPDGTATDVSSLIEDVDSRFLGAQRTAWLAEALDGADLPMVDLGATRIGPPVAGIGKIICVGLNYRRHAIETGQEVPTEPVLFMKAPYTVVGPDDTVLIPPHSTKTDYEVELAVVIGRPARYLAAADDALRYVAGYTISHDVSERAFQLDRGGQWDKGKNCETFNPLGPWLATPDEVPDPQALELSLSVNGELRQRSSTGDMIFPVSHLIWYVSQFMTLLPGDIINTGTPAGVGMALDPPRYLRDGDVVELTITGLGTQRQTLHQPAHSGADLGTVAG